MHRAPRVPAGAHRGEGRARVLVDRDDRGDVDLQQDRGGAGTPKATTVTLRRAWTQGAPDGATTCAPASASGDARSTASPTPTRMLRRSTTASPRSRSIVASSGALPRFVTRTIGSPVPSVTSRVASMVGSTRSVTVSRTLRPIRLERLGHPEAEHQRHELAGSDEAVGRRRDVERRRASAGGPHEQRQQDERAKRRRGHVSGRPRARLGLDRSPVAPTMARPPPLATALGRRAGGRWWSHGPFAVLVPGEARHDRLRHRVGLTLRAFRGRFDARHRSRGDRLTTGGRVR